MANWEDLNIGMPLDKSSMLRVLISSKDKVIGQCTLSRPKLLGGRKNQKGFFVVRSKLSTAQSYALCVYAWQVYLTALGRDLTFAT